MPQRRKPDLSQDPLVERLVPDPRADPPNATVLRGFLGRSPNGGHLRLYLDATLREFVEIADDDILDSEKVEAPDAPLGTTTTLWVRAGAAVQHTVSDSRQTQAEFLAGEIAGRFLNQTTSTPERPMGSPPRGPGPIGQWPQSHLFDPDCPNTPYCRPRPTLLGCDTGLCPQPFARGFAWPHTHLFDPDCENTPYCPPRPSIFCQSIICPLPF